MFKKCVLILAIFTVGCPKDQKDSPEGMVYIPKGTFQMGGKSNQAEPDEFPLRKVEVSAFFMDETEVTNRQYQEFVEATGYVTVAERTINWEELSKQLPAGTPKPADSLLQPGSLVFKPTNGQVDLEDYSQWWEWVIGAYWKSPEGRGSNLEGRMDHPVVHISLEDAISYAQWVGKRLPTEAEWEWASMGGVENAKYPWGNEPVEKAYDKANFWQGIFPYKNYEQDGFYGTAPVKSFLPNGYGLYDMAGNVWELCQDKYHFEGYKQGINSLINPKGPDRSFDPREPYIDKQVIRGGSFLCDDSYCSGYRSARRMGVDVMSGLNHTGFRCVKSL